MLKNRELFVYLREKLYLCTYNLKFIAMRKSFFPALWIVLVAIMCSACASSPEDYKLGTIKRDTILGVPCNIYLPYSYSKQQQSECFPVLYLQHGMFGSEDDWVTQGNLLAIMDSLLKEKKVAEIVVVMPDNFLGSIPPEERRILMEAPNLTPEGDTIDISNGTAHWRKLTYEQEKSYEMSGFWESHFPEFMAEVEQRYNVSRNPGHRAIAGLSMGGFHTMHISHFLHGQFAYIGLFSAYLACPLVGEVYVNWQEEVRALMTTSPVYWIGMGREDFLYAQLQEYRNWLDENHMEYTYYESAGEHTWINWRDYISRFLIKIR